MQILIGVVIAADVVWMSVLRGLGLVVLASVAGEWRGRMGSVGLGEFLVVGIRLGMFQGCRAWRV